MWIASPSSRFLNAGPRLSPSSTPVIDHVFVGEPTASTIIGWWSLWWSPAGMQNVVAVPGYDGDLSHKIRYRFGR